MIEPGEKAGIINKVSFKNKVNIFSASSNEDLETIQNYINNNDEKEFWSSFDFSRLDEEDWIDVFTDKESKDFHKGILVKEKFIGIIKKCHFDGFVFREGGKILSISPALKRKEVIGLFDSSLLSPFISVKGNNDFFLNYPTYKNVTIQNVRFHLEHGTTLNKYNIEERVKSSQCDVFLFGHTHRKFVQKYNDILILNPGSTSLPRDGKSGSFLLITFSSKEDLKYEFISLQ